MHSHYIFEKNYNEIKRQRLNKANTVKSYSPKPFTIWTERPKPTDQDSVFRFAIASGVSVLQLQNDLEKIGFLTSEYSLIDTSIINKLKELSDLYK
jgi:hypothetical protein|tara:strand:+ start:212 stop:499 length:288 start_codon:yes stop_codon:yes gene_type:complete